MISYNHQDFIAKAIDSILMQKVDFEYEIIIGDDCSKDNTAAIIEQYRAKFPLIIKPLKYEKNVGMIQNCINVLSACTGKYIAILEGDDYWTDKLKLQTQVDFLEQNDDYVMCYHDVNSLKNNKLAKAYHWNVPDTTDQDYLLKNGNFIITLSVMFRNKANIVSFLTQCKTAPFGDFLIYIAATEQGKIKYIKKNMGVYRVHDGGVWSQLGALKATQKYIDGLILIQKILPENKKNYIKALILTRIEGLLTLSDTPETIDFAKSKCIELGYDESILELLKLKTDTSFQLNYMVKFMNINTMYKAIKEKYLIKYWN